MSISHLGPSLGASVTGWTFAERDPLLWAERESTPLSTGAALERLPFFLCLHTHPSPLCPFYPGLEESFLISVVIKCKKKKKKKIKGAAEASVNSTLRRRRWDRSDGANVQLRDENS